MSLSSGVRHALARSPDPRLGQTWPRVVPGRLRLPSYIGRGVRDPGDARPGTPAAWPRWHPTRRGANAARRFQASTSCSGGLFTCFVISFLVCVCGGGSAGRDGFLMFSSFKFIGVINTNIGESVQNGAYSASRALSNWFKGNLWQDVTLISTLRKRDQIPCNFFRRVTYCSLK